MRLKIGLIMTLFCLALPARAQTFPQGQRLNIGTEASPDVRQCYKFNEFKEIEKFKLDCAACAEENNLLNLQLNIYREVVAQSDKIVLVQDDSIKALKTDNDRLYNMWKEENLKRHQAEEKPSWQTWIPWAVAGILGASTVFLTGWVIAN